MRRKIEAKYVYIWGLLAALFFVVLLTPPAAGWWVSAFMLGWFAFWEARGILSVKAGDTCSELVWAVLKVRDGRPVNLALVPLVAGIFCGFGVMFVGLVAGAGDYELPRWCAITAAGCLALGTLGFLARHFWVGSNR